jgi:hypothetical protein
VVAAVLLAGGGLIFGVCVCGSVLLMSEAEFVLWVSFVHVLSSLLRLEGPYGVPYTDSLLVHFNVDSGNFHGDQCKELVRVSFPMVEVKQMERSTTTFV